MLMLAAIVVSLGVFANAQDHCCTPAQYEGYWSLRVASYYPVTGEAEAEARYTRISMDTTDASHLLIYGDVLVRRNVYTNERSSNKFLISGDIEYTFNDTHCDSHPADPPVFTGCITDSDEFQTTSYVGIGEHTLRFHAWRLAVTNQTATLAVTDSCIPLAYDAAGSRFGGPKGPVGFAIAAVMVRFTEGIRDTSVFTPPAICNPSS